MDGIAGPGQIVRKHDVIVNRQSPKNKREKISNPMGLKDSYVHMILYMSYINIEVQRKYLFFISICCMQ